MQRDSDRNHSSISDDRPLVGRVPGDPAEAEHGAVPDITPETGGPAFSKGAYKAGDPLPGASVIGVHDATDSEITERAGAQPDRR